MPFEAGRQEFGGERGGVEIVNNDRLNYRRAIIRARDVKPSGGSRDVKPILLCLFLVFVSGIGSGIGSHLGIADRIADSPLSPQAPLDANRSGKIGLRAPLIDGSHQLLLRLCCASSTLRRDWFT